MHVPVPPLGGQMLLLFLLQVCLLLTAALLLGRLASRLNFSPVVGELLTGVLLGPSLLGFVVPPVSGWLFPHEPAQMHLLDAFGQIGVLMLVGITGMQLDLQLVRRRIRTAAAISLPGFVIPLLLGVAAGFLLPAALIPQTSNRVVLAVFLGVAMCVTAIPVIAKTLMDLNLLHRNVGQLILMSGTVDDLLGWVGLSMVTAMATTGLHAVDLLHSVGSLVGFLLAAALVGRPLVGVVMRRAVRSSEQTATVTTAVLVILACAATTHLLHLEAVFGALVGGVLVRRAIDDAAVRLAGLQTMTMAVLAPVFFALAGLRMDLTLLARPEVLFTGLVLLAVAIIGKFTGAMLGARLCGLTRYEALAVGAGMNSRGIIEVIVATVGLRTGVLDVGLYTVVVLIAIVTSLMGPPVLRFAVARVAESDEERLRRATITRVVAVETPE